MMKQSQQGPLVDVIQQAQMLLQRDGDILQSSCAQQAPCLAVELTSL